MLIQFKDKNYEISLEEICKVVQTLEEYANILAYIEKIVTSIENPFLKMEESNIYNQCKSVYTVLDDGSYLANDLYFATEFLVHVYGKNILQSIKEREIFNKTVKLLIDICSELLESKIAPSNFENQLCLQVLAIELIIRLNRDIIKSKIYYTQKEVAYLFTNRFLPSLVFEFEQMQGVEHKKVSSNWIGRKLKEIGNFDSEVICIGNKNYLSINAVKELEEVINRVYDSLEIGSMLEEEVITLENKFLKQKERLLILKEEGKYWRNEINDYFEKPITLLYKVMFTNYYIQLYIVISRSTLPLTDDEIIEQLEFQFKKKTGFNTYLKENISLLREISESVYSFIGSLSRGSDSKNILEDFSAVINLSEVREEIAISCSAKAGNNIYDTARDKKGLGSDCNVYMDTLKNVSHSFKNSLDKTALKHIDSIENNLLYLKTNALEK